jgi:hypothetical protein
MKILPAVAFLAVAVVATCGGEAPAAGPGGQGARPVANDRSVVVHPDSVFEIQDLIEAGWKKNREFGTESLPHARIAVFGFFNQRDVEVWVYDSHRHALDHGVGPAETAIARKPGQTDYLIPAVNRFHAYAVAGNLVLLCEIELADCMALIDRLKRPAAR